MSTEPLEKRAQRILLTAASISAVGVAVAGTVSRVAGGVIVVAGWLAFLYGLHAFGRAGSSRPATDERPDEQG